VILITALSILVILITAVFIFGGYVHYSKYKDDWTLSDVQLLRRLVLSHLFGWILFFLSI
jgi:hypothetical protein